MAPISAEINFANSRPDLKLSALNNETKRCDIGDRKIALTGFEVGGEAIISRKLCDSKTDKNPKTITVPANKTKDFSFKFIDKHGLENTANLHFSAK